MKLDWMRTAALAVTALLAVPAWSAQPAQSADVLVYGATASGVIAAYAAGREGMHVILLEPRAHVGGMVTGGLSATDLGHYVIIGGYARDFFMRAAAHYGVTNLDKPQNWRSEPHVAEAVFRAMLHEAGVKVYFHERLREHGGVKLDGKRIVSITTEDGRK